MSKTAAPRQQAPAAPGFTLLEMMIALAIIAVLASLALPSFGAAVARQRLKAAAELLAADLAEARFEAARRGMPLHLNFRAGRDWCWATTTTSACDCSVQQSCRVKSARSADHPGVELVEASDVRFDPANGTARQPVAGNGAALLRSQRGELLSVSLSGLGRAKVCSPGGGLPGYPRC